MKKLFPAIAVVLTLSLIIALGIFINGCDKKDNAPTTPANKTQQVLPDYNNHPSQINGKNQRLNKTTVTCPPDRFCGPMDVAFIIDNTGSMYYAIENVKSELSSILNCIETVSGNDYRLSLMTFADVYNPPPPYGNNQELIILNNFANNNKAAVGASIAALSAGGGNGNAEASDEALRTAINARTAADANNVAPAGTHQNIDYTPDWRAWAKKIIILVTDSPPSGFDDAYVVGTDDVNAHLRAQEAAAKGIHISAVYVPTYGDLYGQAAIMQDYATTSSGVYVLTADDGSGTAAGIIDIISTCGTGEIPISVDIHPGSCPNPINMKSKGIVPVAILGSGTFDVTQVDLSTVKLNGVSPTNWHQYQNAATPFIADLVDCYSCNTAAPDAYTDCSLKFDTQTLVGSLGQVTDGECRVLELTGKLLPAYGGKPIRGADIIRIINK